MSSSELMQTEIRPDVLLRVSDLSVSYKTLGGLLTAVDKASLEIGRDEIHALIGESGCGKSTLGLSVPRLLQEGQVVYSGEVVFKGIDILSLREKDVQKYRGTQIASIFQEPMTSLNPVYRIGDQIAEALSVKQNRDGARVDPLADSRRPRPSQAALGRNVSVKLPNTRGIYRRFEKEVLDLLRKVRVADPEHVAKSYPHQLSGGMRQRVMIAIALAESPSLLVADEPTTALDVTTQAQILNLIKSLSREYGMSTLLITHDLGVVGAIADYASVMYAGRIVEEAPTSELFSNPLHPYTVGLFSSYPKERKGKYQLKTIPGTVPAIGNYPDGCRFHPRCSKALPICSQREPQLIEVSPRHKVSCFLYGGSND